MARPASVAMNAGGVASNSRVNNGASSPKAIARRQKNSAAVYVRGKRGDALRVLDHEHRDGEGHDELDDRVPRKLRHIKIGLHDREQHAGGRHGQRDPELVAEGEH
jgi:hypothetical protein